MNTTTLANGTKVYWYFEDSVTGRIIVTLAEKEPGLFAAHREWWNDAKIAKEMFDKVDTDYLESRVARMKTMPTVGEVKPDGTAKPEFDL